MSQICIHFIVSGNVQGVFYRAYTQKQAKMLGLTGWVKNLPTGGVEVLACGEREHVEQLQKWLWSGPKYAFVSKVTFQEISSQNHSDFTIVY